MRKTNIFLALLLLPLTALAYEQPVHSAMTRKAFHLAARSNTFLQRLGFASGTPVVNGNNVDSIVALGATQEDDGLRPLNHFFDPVHGIELRVVPFCLNGTPGVDRADRWAQDGLLNDWSIRDAKGYLRDAIAGPTPGIRENGYARLFRSMGQFVHLVQDMAQPEHTRNDQHRWGSTLGSGSGSTPGSLYEAWTLSNLIGTPTVPARYPDIINGFQVAVLPTYADYFRSGDGRGLAEFSNRNFVTQDTNYDTYGTWALFHGRCVTFTEPVLANATQRVEVITDYVLNDPAHPGPSPVTRPELVYSYDAYDALKDISVTDAYHTHVSSIDHEIKLMGQSDPLTDGEGIFSLSDLSYLQRAAILVPRAVEYSAGMMNHFFRGQVSVTWLPNTDGSWDLTLRNDSSERLGRETRIMAFYKATPQYFNRTTGEDMQLIVDDVVAGWYPDFDGLEPGEAVRLTHIPVLGLHPDDTLMQFERRILVIGSLGDEGGAVIPLVQQASTGLKATFEASNPTVVSARLLCRGRIIDLPNGVETEFTVAAGEECRGLIQHTVAPAIGDEGPVTSIRLRVTRNGRSVEDVSASIDAGDSAVGG
ncbi:MAG TPA: hypothetical protein VF698_20560, partial [Thermoanaerobaculia bacterium]